MRFLLFVTLFIYSCSEPTNKSVPEKKKADMKANEPKPVAKKEEAFDILHFLLDEEGKDAQKKKIDYQKHFISFQNDEDPYSVSFSILKSEDFNKDGIPDYIVYRSSEGMLGGNINTNSDILYLIVGEGNQILQRHEILTYAPFSYNILEDVTYKNGKLKANATQNFRTYFPEDGEELKSTNLSFIYKNGNVYEESYLTDCELAKWKNKQIFKGKSEVTRTIEMHNYTELVYEKHKTEEFEFSAEFSGCDNLNLVLEAKFSYRGKKQEFLLEKRDRFLEYLKNNTSLEKEIASIQSYFADTDLSEEAIELDGFTFRLYTSHEKGKTIFRLILDQIKNPDQTENWEITTRH